MLLDYEDVDVDKDIINKLLIDVLSNENDKLKRDMDSIKTDNNLKRNKIEQY